MSDYVTNQINAADSASELMACVRSTERVMGLEYDHSPLWTPERIEALRAIARDFDALFADLNAAESQRLLQAPAAFPGAVGAA